MKNLRLLPLLVLLAFPAQAQEMSAERMAVVVNWTNLQNAVAALIARAEKSEAETAALESRLATAMEWLKAAQAGK